MSARKPCGWLCCSSIGTERSTRTKCRRSRAGHAASRRGPTSPSSQAGRVGAFQREGAPSAGSARAVARIRPPVRAQAKSAFRRRFRVIEESVRRTLRDVRRAGRPPRSPLWRKPGRLAAGPQKSRGCRRRSGQYPSAMPILQSGLQGRSRPRGPEIPETPKGGRKMSHRDEQSTARALGRLIWLWTRELKRQERRRERQRERERQRRIRERLRRRRVR